MVGGAVAVLVAGVLAKQAGQNAFAELFAQFHPPLIKRIHIPDHALHEGPVFVERDECADGFRRCLLHRQGVARLVARNHFVGSKPLNLSVGAPFRRQFCPGFFQGFAGHHGSGLAQAIGKQVRMMGGNRIVSGQGDDEVCRNQAGALVNQLVVGVLPVGTNPTPDDRPGLPGQGLAALGHALAVALHVQLLEMVRQAAQVVIVGQDGVGLGAPEIVVPDPEHRHDDRQVLMQWRLPEVLVHGMGAGQ